MHRRLLAVAAAVFMALPGTALAADPTPAETTGSGATVTGYYYYVAGVELGGETYKFDGKLWIEGDQLGASVGCNSMGARVRFDGSSLEILEGIMTTEIGCPEEIARAEAVLGRALASGPLRWDGSGFAGTDIRILVSEVNTQPVTPPDQIIVPPDTPITSEPDPLPVIDPETCREFLTEDEWAAIFGGPVDGSGSGEVIVGGGGSDGSGTSGGSSDGGTDPGTQTPGTEPLPPDPMPVPAEPEPTEVVDPVPGEVPGSNGTIEDPAPPPVEPAPLPVDQTVAEPGPATSDVVVGSDTVVITATDGDDVPVTETKDGPAPTPSAEFCRELLARINVAGAPQPASGPDAAPVAEKAGDGDAEMGRDLAAAASVRPEVAFALVLLGGLLLIAWLRTTVGQPRRL